MQSNGLVLLLLLVGAIPLTNAGEEGGAQACVSTFAQATCMGPWFGWNEPTHLNQGFGCLSTLHC